MSTIVDIMQEYLDEVAARPTFSDVGRVLMAPGTEITWDDCCNGQLSIRLDQVTAPSIVSGRRPSMRNCQVEAWDYTLEITSLRCAAVVNDAGEPPSPMQVSNDATEELADMLVIRDVLLANENTYWLDRWMALTMEGGCHGGAWRFVVRSVV